MANPLTDLPNNASRKPTWSFHERYASDAEFKRQVDEGRRRSRESATQQQIQSALDMQNQGRKLY